MKLSVKGKSNNITTSIVGVLNNCEMDENTFEVYTNNDNSSTHPSAVITKSDSIDSSYSDGMPFVYNLPYLDHINSGDIVAINPSGFISTIYRLNSNSNFLFFTDRCNSNCLMCSQPPRDREDVEYYYNINKSALPLIPKNTPELGITGGEPTLWGEKLFSILDDISIELPETELHMLTNGRLFGYKKFARKFRDIATDRLMLGIPLYSDYYGDHDYIVQSKDAYTQTIMGLYNLAELGMRIEIRIVLHKLSIPRLKKLSKFIYMNLPFVEHIAFMGLEYTGFTPRNKDVLWIDPIEYMEELNDAVLMLGENDMNVSIYNLPLCILPREIWKYSKKSISDWKQIYLDECQNCKEIDNCGGFFLTSNKKHSNFIKAIT